MRLAVVALYAVSLALLAACNGSPGHKGPGEPPTSIPQPGQHWGGFLFCDQPAPCILPPDQVTPAPRPLKDEEGELLFSRHPGYREFKTIDDLGRFVNGRAVLRAPQFLPADAELLGGYAVVGDDGRIFVVGISYRLGQGNADINNPDLWINYDLYTQRPLAIGKSPQQSESSTAIYGDVLLTIRGQEAIFQPPSSSDTRGSLNWFENDGSFWSVQARGLDLTTLAEIAESLTDFLEG